MLVYIFSFSLSFYNSNVCASYEHYRYQSIIRCINKKEEEKDEYVDNYAGIAIAVRVLSKTYPISVLLITRHCI